MFNIFKKYISNRVQLVKLELIDVLSNLVVKLISSFFLLIISMFVLLMFSFSISFWFASLLGSYSLGFAITGLIYTFIFIVYMIFIKKPVETKIKDAIVKAAFAAEKESK